MKKKYLFKYFVLTLICGLGFSLRSQAQDVNFSQFYNNPLHLNPALTGTNPHWRFASSYRNQWTNIPGNYGVNTASFDYNLDYYHTGLGVMLMNDRALNGNFQTSRLSLFYCYYLLLGNGWMARAGLEGNVTFKSVNYDGLVFEDQLPLTDLGFGGSTEEEITSNSVSYGDFNAGAMFYNQNFWFGVSFHNLMNPYHRFLTKTDRYPLRFSGQMGAKIWLNHDGEVALSPALLFNKQSTFQQLDAGMNFHIHYIRLGIWYRGLPFLPTLEDSPNQDAVVLFCGLKYRGLQFGYSYDYGMSELTGKGSTHEFSLILQPWYDRRNKRGTEHVDCPIF